MNTLWTGARPWLLAGVTCLSLLLEACGGGGGGSSNSNADNSNGNSSSGNGGGVSTSLTVSGANVLTMTVEPGPSTSTANVPFVSITVCATSGSPCDTIDHVMVDTGSTGLRILSGSVPNSLASMTRAVDISSAPLSECETFLSGYTWGSVRLGNVSMGSEVANNVPIQIVGDPAAGTVPSDCSNIGSSIGTTALMGANAILGVKGQKQDCGSPCVVSAYSPFYYACSSSCTSTRVLLGQQITNPVSLLPTDNNGVVLELPSVGSTGALTATGALVFGINTQTNNQVGSLPKLPLDYSHNLIATYNGSALSGSFLDSGSNFIFLTDSSLPKCTGTGFTTFYCPTSVTSKNATLTSSYNSSSTASYSLSFSVGNAQTLLTNNSNYALNNIADDLGLSSQGVGIDFGLPVFYGRNIFVGMEDSTSSTLPYGYLALVSNGS